WPSGLVQHLRDLPLNHRVCVEEGSPPVRMEPFKSFTARPASAASALASESVPIPDSAETWLLVLIAAPDFSLPDLAGRVQTLAARRGTLTLLHFWSAVPDCERDLAELNQSYRRWASEGLQLLTVNVDEPASLDGSLASALNRHLSFPILRASPDTIAIYNLLYRYLFDRHHDLSLPTSFLIDKTGAIVKIYQGTVPKQHFDRDFRNIPQTAAERLAKALPFPGVSETFEFARNYLSLGSVFFERGYMEQAETCLQLAFRDDPSAAEALYGLGSVYLQREKAEKARQSFERALQLRANYPGTLPNAWNNLGILAARAGRTDEAIQNFQQALQIDPDHLIALDNLGNA